MAAGRRRRPDPWPDGGIQSPFQSLNRLGVISARSSPPVVPSRGDCCPIYPQEAPGHAPAPPGPGVVFLGLSGPGLAGSRRPTQPGRLLAESAAPPPTGHRLALACAQPAGAAGSHQPGGRTLGALAQLLRLAPAPHVSARGGTGRGGRSAEGCGLLPKAGVCKRGGTG